MSAPYRKDAWFSTPRRVSADSIRLFCLPHAGGGASAFFRWADALSPFGIEVCAIRTPGRETRLCEPPYTDFPLLVADLGNAIRPRLDRPYALFGHSLGALIAFELVRWLEDRRSPAPLHLFVAGGHAPVTIGDKEALHLIADDEEFLDAVGSSYGSIPPTVRNNPELKQIVTATLRADMTLAECYDGSDRRQISADITAYAGLDDRCIEESKVLRWRECTKGEFSYQCCRGDHFFVHEADAGVTGRVGRRLALCT